MQENDTVQVKPSWWVLQSVVLIWIPFGLSLFCVCDKVCAVAKEKIVHPSLNMCKPPAVQFKHPQFVLCLECNIFTLMIYGSHICGFSCVVPLVHQPHIHSQAQQAGRCSGFQTACSQRLKIVPYARSASSLQKQQLLFTDRQFKVAGGAILHLRGETKIWVSGCRNKWKIWMQRRFRR